MFQDESALEAALSEPTPGVIDTMGRMNGDLMLLGAAGKMGLSLARMAKRASDLAGKKRRVIAVSRFSGGGEDSYRQAGVEVLHSDLLQEIAVSRLPHCENVIYMLGRKFGSTGDESTTWGVNCYIPSLICKHFYGSRIVAFSTGNVYPHSPVTSRGPNESTPLNPVGEYGMSALGRERMFEFFSKTSGIPMAIIRLNYACDLRYGVLVDLATKVWHMSPIDLGMGYFNTIWQGDANAMTLRAFDHVSTPPAVFNVTGPEVLSVREVCNQFAEGMKKTPWFTEQEGPSALLSDATKAIQLWGPLVVPTRRLIEWVADWVSHDRRLLNKPTHFESRDGKF